MESAEAHVHLTEESDPSQLYNNGDIIEVQAEENYDFELVDQQEMAILTKEASEQAIDMTHINTIEILQGAFKVLEEVAKLEKDFGTIEKQHRESVTNMIAGPTEILKKQYSMILEIIQLKSENQEEIIIIQKKYQDLGTFGIKFNKKSDLCLNMLTHCLNLSSKVILKDLRVEYEIFLKTSEKDRLDEIKILVSKLITVCEMLPFAATFDKTDFFTLQNDPSACHELKEVVKIVTLAPPDVIQRSYGRFLRSFAIGVSMLSRGDQYKNPIAKILLAGVGVIYDTLATSKTRRRVQLFYSKPSQKLAFKVWNLLDQKALLYIFRVAFPTVKHSRKVYIPRLYNFVTFDSIKRAYNDQTLNTTSPLILLKNETVSSQKVQFSYSALRQNGENRIPVRVISSRPLPVTKNAKRLKLDKEKIIDPQQNFPSALVPNHENLALFGLIKGVIPEAETSFDEGSTSDQDDSIDLDLANLTKQMSETTIKEIKQPERKMAIQKGITSYFDGVVLHIHGGGFVAMSSASHQAYTRQWARAIQKPILSVDYRLAPEHPYPAALDDCWQAYNWVLDEMENSLGIKPKNIVLVGDSAGGNLVLGITLLAIKNKVRIPNGILLAYPALKMEVNTYSPSLLLSLHDQILPYSVLKLIPGVYIPPEGQPDKDPFLSPLKASDQLLEMLPPVRIMVGDRDPFHDDCWRFVDRLKKLNKDVQMTVYQELSHGFLGYAFPGAVSEAKKCISDAALMLLELLGKPSKKSLY